MKIDEAASRLEALGNPTRLKIYRALVRAGQAGMPVGRLQEKLKVAPSTLSHHIKSLVSVGLISQVREATTLVCHAEYDTMRDLSISSSRSAARTKPDALRRGRGVVF